uniref:C-type lectin n=1 Tax=Hippocampus abdominalis TaxID=109274 RepID=A0A1Y1C0X1_HIPAB|nr:C-type lectin [Hippocampus abdominalis]
MAFALRLLFLLCGISGLLTGAWSFKKIQSKDNNCPKGWTRLDCFCYIFERDPRNFADAESVCNIMEGNLVSIHSLLESEFVRFLAAEGGNAIQFWTGLNDALLAEDYIWTDGTVNDFTNFQNDPPPDNNDDCVQLLQSDGEWVTADCTDLEQYVCIRDVRH